MPFTVEPNAEPIPGYRLIDRLGKGGFGEVWKAQAPGGLLKAIKIVHGDTRTLDDDGSHRAGQELAALQRVQSIRHPYLLSLERYDIIDGRLIIVTELADCNLFDRYEHFTKLGQSGIPRDILLRYMRETAEVLDLMNQTHQLQHLDIKPQNLFLIHDHVKVADFGLVKDLEGKRTELTGGVTPIYAAPETFEHRVITPFCDQYSLAIVYQELLTGRRPFNGMNMQQLMMQHIQASPDLAALPRGDRPAIAKALAKKPHNRHPSCMALVEALEDAVEATIRRSGARVSDSATRPRPKNGSPNVAQSIRRLEQKHVKPFRPETPPTLVRVRREEPAAPSNSDRHTRTAPPEFKGNGVLFPAIVIGIGRGGMLALKRVRQTLCERFGGMSALPHIRLLWIDTDPETAEIAAQGIGGASLEADEILLTRLNRASHYLKPRRNGRSLIEGWFDAQWLYRIPRNPLVSGQRALGRLAFGDCYQSFCERLDKSLENITNPDALLRADRNTSLGMRTNRPRMYVIAGLGGGTGSGMFLDVAYAARRQLTAHGYDRADLTGMLFLPRVERGQSTGALATANCYAALTELVHFSHPDSRHMSTFDDREVSMAEAAAPFARCVILPWDQAARSGSTTDGPMQAADFLVRELTSNFGVLVNADREAVLKASRPTDDAVAATFGLSVFAWPRRAMLYAAARRLCRLLIQRWITAIPGAPPDKTPEPRPVIEAWVDQQRAEHRITAGDLTHRLTRVCHDVCGGREPEQLFEEMVQPFSPKRWFAAAMDPNAGFELLAQFDELLGKVETNAHSQLAGLLGDALLSAAEAIVKDWGGRLAQFAVALIEQPEFRLAGAERAATYLRESLLETARIHGEAGDKLAEQARKAYLRMSGLLHGSPGRRGMAEFADLVKRYPQWRFNGMLNRQLADICQTLCNDLSEQLGEIHFCRQRLGDLIETFRRDSEAPSACAHDLLPLGCETPDQAIEVLLAGVSEADLVELDRRIQRMVQSQFTAIVHVCMSTSNMLGNLEPAMLKLAQQFLETRLGDTGVAELFFARHADAHSAATAVSRAFDDAAPPIGDTIGVMVQEVCALVVPPGSSGEHFADLTRSVLDIRLGTAIGHDDVAFYRELPRLPLSHLPQLGALAREAYRYVTERDHFPPHTRSDVEQWLGAAS